MMKFLALVVLIASLEFSFSKHLPPGLKKCDLGDPNFQPCFTQALEDGIHAFLDGKKAYGIPSLNPLQIDKMVIGEGQGAVKVVQNYQDIAFTGVNSLKVLKASYDPKANILSTTVKYNSVSLKAHYNMDGNILVLPIKGSGPCEIVLIEPEFEHVFQFEDVTKKGKTYLHVVKQDLDIRPKKITFNFENLFDGNVQLSTVLLQTINDNWAEVFNDVKQGYEASLGLIFTEIANRFFSQVPKEEIFS